MQLRSKRERGLPEKIIHFFFFCALSAGFVPSPVFLPEADAQCVAWTDNPLTSSTPIKATHVQQMRNCINTKRTAAGMSAFVFTDPVLTAGTSVVRAKHFLEVEQAVQGFYERDTNWGGWFQSTYAAPFLDINLYTASPGGYVNAANLGPVNKAIKASTINTLRDAIDGGGYCGDGVCQIYNGLLATNPAALPESCGPGKCDIDCDAPCSTVTSACSGGALACGSSTCVPGQRCQTVTCYCTTTYTCIADGACPTICPNQNYNTASCGSVTIPSVAVGNNSSVACGGSCSGNVTGACDNSGTFTGITDGCALNCPAQNVILGGGCPDLTLPAGTASGTTANYGCPSPCVPGSGINATCTNGIWSGISGSCILPVCADLVYTTASCGNVTIPSTTTGNNSSVACPGPCTGNVTATCSGTTFTGITDGCAPPGNCNAQVVPTALCGNATLPATIHGNVGTAYCPAGSCGTVSGTCNNGSFIGVTENCAPAYWDTYTVAAAPAANSTNRQSFKRCYPSSFTVITSTGSGAGGCSSPGIPGTVCTLTVTNSCPASPSCSDGVKNYGEKAIDCGGPCAACGTCGQKTCYKCSGTSCVSDITGTHTVSNCSNTCIAFCGNGILDVGEDCDPPAVRSNTNCAGSPGLYCAMPGCIIEPCCGTMPC